MASEQNCCGNLTELSSKAQCKSNFQFVNNEKLNYEEERIKSFSSWPVHFPVDPSRLAKAGFYYTGIADEVICFSCLGRVKNWNYGDIVLKKHADLYPNCDFIKNSSNNIPLLKTSSKSKAQPLTIENVSNINSDCSKSDVIDYNKMKSESERLKTFSGKWPLSFIKASTLARAGFFYTGVDCKVQCPYCKGTISNWEVNSVPFQEHLKQFPWCDYLSENISSLLQSSARDICGNMVIKTTPSFNRAPTCNRLGNDGLKHANLEDLGVHLHKTPFHSQQASLTTRLRSFANWPPFVPVSKEDLAAAGFFYTGVSDRTICFHCNGGLCSWEEGDDPWIEHARWNPTCDFLRLNKGSDFIKSCTVQSSSNKVKQNDLPQPDGIGNKEPLLKKVDDAMKSNLVKYVLETELFPSYIVRAAILLQIKQTGNIFTSIDDLCCAASYLKDEMEKQSFDVEPIPAEDLNINVFESPAVADAPVEENFSCVVSQNYSNPMFDKESLKSAGHTEKSKSLEEVDLRDNCICKVCMDKEVGVVFLPCGHLPVCTICAPALKHCPMCRKSIQATVRVYLN